MAVGADGWLKTYDAGSKVMLSSLASAPDTAHADRLPVAEVARGPAVGVPVPALREAGGGTEEMVLGPDHQVGHAGQHRRGAARADVGLLGAAGRDGADHPFAVRARSPGGRSRCGHVPGPVPVRDRLPLRLRRDAAFPDAALPGLARRGRLERGMPPFCPSPAACPLRAPGRPLTRPASTRDGRVDRVRLVIARCSVDYVGRLKAHLPLATRLLLVKADGSVLVHSDGGSYKPLNWMSPPAILRVSTPEEADVEAGRGRTVDRPVRQDRRPADHQHPRAAARHLPRAGPGPRPDQGRRRGRPAAAAGRPDRDASATGSP